MERRRRSLYQDLWARMSPDQIERINRVLVALPETNLYIFKSLCEGFTQSEIAQALSWSQAHVSRTQAQTLKALGEILKC